MRKFWVYLLTALYGRIRVEVEAMTSGKAYSDAEQIASQQYGPVQFDAVVPVWDKGMTAQITQA